MKIWIKMYVWQLENNDMVQSFCHSSLNSGYVYSLSSITLACEVLKSGWLSWTVKTNPRMK